MVSTPAGDEFTREESVTAVAERRPLFSEFGADEVAGAGFGRRALAKGVDAVVLNVFEFATMVVLGSVFFVLGAMRGIPQGVMRERLAATSPTSLVIGVFAFILYFTILESMWGSTPGKRLLGLVVVTEDLQPCPFAAALKRNLMLLLELLAWGIPALLAIKNSNRAQRHGDRWAGTIVPSMAAVPSAPRRGAGQVVVASVLAFGAVALLMGLSVYLRLAPLSNGA